MLCYVSPLNIGGSLAFSLWCGGLTVALSLGLSFLLGHLTLHTVRSFEGQLTMLLPSLLCPACDWSRAVAQILWGTGAWHLRWSWGSAAFRLFGIYVPQRRTFWWNMEGWQVKWRSPDSRNPPYCKMSAAVLSVLIVPSGAVFSLYHANRAG